MGRIRKMALGMCGGILGVMLLFAGVVLAQEGGTIVCATLAGECEVEYPEGEIVTLTAVPAEGYVFTKWGGDCIHAGRSKTCILAMSVNRVISAQFEKKPPKPKWRR
jgi:hypothetical protein